MNDKTELNAAGANADDGGGYSGSEEKKQGDRYTPSRLRRGRRKFGRRELIILLIPALAAVCAVAVMLFVAGKEPSYQFTQGACLYYGGSTAHIEAGAELKQDSDGETVLEQSGRSEPATLPIYLDGSRKVVLPVDMVYYMPRSGSYLRAACFSELECKANGTVTVCRNRNSAQIEQGFLFDGGDMYLSLEDMTLSFNGYTMDAPALSYVEAVYGGYFMFFNYDTKEFFIELSDGTGTARPGSGDYTISLIGDSMTLYDGTKKLLATRPELFDPIV